jgi:uncharacterized membrane protein (UPF0127 family)
MSRKNTLVALGFLVLAIIAASLVYYSSVRNQASAAVTTSTSIGGGTLASTTATSTAPTLAVVNGITYEVVTTLAQQEQGLGGRSVIPDNYGMLFVFPKDGTYGFWMKDMLANLDMIWLSDNGTIVAINSNVLASSYPYVYYPPQPVKYVIETKAGFAAEKGWHLGTQVQLPAPY